MTLAFIIMLFFGFWMMPMMQCIKSINSNYILNAFFAFTVSNLF